MGQDNSTPSSKDFQDIQIFSLLQFCDLRGFDIGQIREISHYKENNQSEHEFLLAKVVGLSPQSSRWLRIDRTRQEKATNLLNTSSSIFPAYDTVLVAAQVAPLLRLPSSRMSSLQYDAPSGPSLADFRSLLHLVHTMSPEYKLWQEQCYWFCNSIMDIMKNQFPTELVLETAHKRRGKFKNIVHMPSNATAMTNIQRAFKSYLAAQGPSNPANRPRLPHKPGSDRSSLPQTPPSTRPRPPPGIPTPMPVQIFPPPQQIFPPPPQIFPPPPQIFPSPPQKFPSPPQKFPSPPQKFPSPHQIVTPPTPVQKFQPQPRTSTSPETHWANSD